MDSVFQDQYICNTLLSANCSIASIHTHCHYRCNGPGSPIYGRIHPHLGHNSRRGAPSKAGAHSQTQTRGKSQHSAGVSPSGGSGEEAKCFRKATSDDRRGWEGRGKQRRRARTKKFRERSAVKLK